MSEIRTKAAAGKPKRDLATYALFGLSLVGMAAVLYVIGGAVIKPKTSNDLKTLTHGEMAKLVVAAPTGGAAMPDTPILDPQGRTVKLADIKSGITIVNLWATWCAPCRQEMPALARLQAAYPGRVQVIPVAMEKPEDRDKAREFIAQYQPLPFYQDPKLAMSFALTPEAEGLPTTVIYDQSGHERARLSGGAAWDGPDARAVIEALLSGK